MLRCHFWACVNCDTWKFSNHCYEALIKNSVSFWHKSVHYGSFYCMFCMTSYFSEQINKEKVQFVTMLDHDREDSDDAKPRVLIKQCIHLLKTCLLTTQKWCRKWNLKFFKSDPTPITFSPVRKQLQFRTFFRQAVSNVVAYIYHWLVVRKMC